MVLRHIKIEGMPADAKIVGVSDQLRFDRDQLAFKIESESFPEVPVDGSIPELELQCSEVYDTPCDTPLFRLR